MMHVSGSLTVHDPIMVAVRAHPWSDPLRFDDLLRRIGFPES